MVSMTKLAKKAEEDKKKKVVEESSDEESSDEDESKKEDSSDDTSDSSSDSSEEESSDSDSSDDSSDESSEEEKKEVKKGQDKKNGKGKEPEPLTKGSKNKRTDEESYKEQSSVQPEKKKAKQESNGTALPKAVAEWRTANQLTVVDLEDGAVNATAPYEEFADTPFPDYIHKSMKEFKFSKPTAIQAQAWPLAAQDRDIIGIAETGSGKTLAFGYPAIVNIKSMKKPIVGPKVLVLAPTRELAQQIHEVMAKACVTANLNACVVFGGVDKGAQTTSIKKADIVIATPGRLIDLINDGSAKLQNVKYLVLDEADRMLDMGFIPQIRAIVEEIPKTAERQTLMFSATWPVDVQKFAHTYLRSPVQITIGKGGEKLAGAKKVTQIVEVCQERERRQKIKKLLQRLCETETRPRILIFMLYKNSCEALYQELLREQWNVEALHGGKNQAARDKAVFTFKNGSVHILVATDVAARGLDIKDIKYVINGEMPLVMEDYIHRIGRTGRAGESGSAYTIFSPEDKVHARQLVRILEEGSHAVPAELAKIAETAPVTKPRRSTMEQLYGDFAKGMDTEQMMKKPTKITFD